MLCTPPSTPPRPCPPCFYSRPAILSGKGSYRRINARKWACASWNTGGSLKRRVKTRAYESCREIRWNPYRIMCPTSCSFPAQFCNCIWNYNHTTRTLYNSSCEDLCSGISSLTHLCSGYRRTFTDSGTGFIWIMFLRIRRLFHKEQARVTKIARTNVFCVWSLILILTKPQRKKDAG